LKEGRRLIEEYLPVRKVSYEATREKLLRRRDYHLSMLHLWWARRPLAAARAAVYATLVPADGAGNDHKRVEEFMTALCAWSGPMGAPSEAVAEARRQVLAASDGHPPKVLDCFSGGGAIPLEVSRLGGEAYAVELNPVAYLISLCTLVYPQMYGPSLAADVEKWGKWLVEKAREELSGLYPPIGSEPAQQLTLMPRDEQLMLSASMMRPVAYLWTRTVPCPNPTLAPHELHLVRQTWLVKKAGKGKSAGKFIALEPVADRRALKMSYRVVKAASQDGFAFDPEEGSKRGDAACRLCGATVGVEDVRRLGKDGKVRMALLGVAAVRQKGRGKEYLGSQEAAQFVPGAAEIRRRLDALVEETGVGVPDTPLSADDPRAIAPPIYGLNTVGELFTDRQLLALLTCCKLARQAYAEMVGVGIELGRARAVATYLGMIIDRVADRSSSLCHWDNSRETTANTFARQALPMVWDFAETNPFSGSSGDLAEAVSQVAKVVRHCANTGSSAVLTRGSATDPVAGGPFDAVITDPPYYDNIPYSEVSDFFYAWLQRSIGHLYPEHLAAPTTPRRKEIVAIPYRHGGSKDEAGRAYQAMMADVFRHRRNELKPNAPLVVVYAHKTYAGWSTLVDALREARFTIVEAWPLDTEMPTRSVGQGTASLASSIFLVARRREDARVGEWVGQVYPELRRIIGERIKELPAMGVVGDDLVIAAIGAGLRAYTQYASVELPNGEELKPETYLGEVQREVIETVLVEVFGLDRPGIKAIDQVTQFYVMGRFEFGQAWVEFDRANTLAHGVGVELGGPRGLVKGVRALLAQDKGRVQFRDYRQRGSNQALGRAVDGQVGVPLIDVLHRALWLAEEQPLDLRDFLGSAGAEPDQLRLVAQALSGGALSRKGVGTTLGEQSAIQSLLASWKRLVQGNLAGSIR
jgi:putative DNA methylase